MHTPWLKEIEKEERDINKAEWKLYEEKGIPGGQKTCLITGGLVNLVSGNVEDLCLAKETQPQLQQLTLP